MLPLPVDVGEALAGYLQRGRPRVACRRLFLRVNAPSGALSPAGVSNGQGNDMGTAHPNLQGQRETARQVLGAVRTDTPAPGPDAFDVRFLRIRVTDKLHVPWPGQLSTNVEPGLLSNCGHLNETVTGLKLNIWNDLSANRCMRYHIRTAGRTVMINASTHLNPVKGHDNPPQDEQHGRGHHTSVRPGPVLFGLERFLRRANGWNADTTARSGICGSALRRRPRQRTHRDRLRDNAPAGRRGRTMMRPRQLAFLLALLLAPSVVGIARSPVARAETPQHVYDDVKQQEDLLGAPAFRGRGSIGTFDVRTDEFSGLRSRTQCGPTSGKPTCVTIPPTLQLFGVRAVLVFHFRHVVFDGQVKLTVGRRVRTVAQGRRRVEVDIGRATKATWRITAKQGEHNHGRDRGQGHDPTTASAGRRRLHPQGRPDRDRLHPSATGGPHAVQQHAVHRSNEDRNPHQHIFRHPDGGSASGSHNIRNHWVDAARATRCCQRDGGLGQSVREGSGGRARPHGRRLR